MSNQPIQTDKNAPQDINQYFAQVQSTLDIPEEYQPYYYQKTSKEVEQKIKTICLIGMTGVGKSSTANSIVGQQDAFQESSDIESCTFKTKGRFFQWPEQNFTQENELSQEQKETPLLIIDTPGLCDSKGRDTQHIVEMACFMKNISFINSFIICFNSCDPRLDENKQSILKLFSEMFGENFYQNVIICFTRWSFAKMDILIRQKKGVTQDSLITKVITQFQDQINVNLTKEQFIFIENSYNDPEIREGYTDLEINQNTKQLEYLFKKTIKNQAFWCHDLKEVQKENEKLQQKIQEQEKLNQNIQNDMLNQQKTYEKQIQEQKQITQQKTLELNKKDQELSQRDQQLNQKVQEILQKDQEIKQKEQEFIKNMQQQDEQLKNRIKKLEEEEQKEKQLLELLMQSQLSNEEKEKRKNKQRYYFNKQKKKIQQEKKRQAEEQEYEKQKIKRQKEELEEQKYEKKRLAQQQEQERLKLQMEKEKLEVQKKQQESRGFFRTVWRYVW